MLARLVAALLTPFAMLALDSTARAQDARTLPFVVGTVDGTLRALALDDEGRPRDTIATAHVDDRLGFVAWHPRAPLVYVVGASRLFVLAWQAEARRFAFRAAIATGARGTHVDVSPDGRFAAIASYGSHSVLVLPLDADGVPTGTIHRLGADDDPTFRNAHQVRFAKGGSTLLIPCLGADHTATIALRDDAAPLLLATATTPEGAGPRHLDFHPTAPLAFVLNELASSVTSYRIDAGTGTLTPLDTTSALPVDAAEASRSSDIHVHPNGRVLFAIHREPREEIVTMTIDTATGALETTARTPTGGRHARSFALSAAGDRLWVGNTWSEDVTTFAVAADGAPTPVGTPWPAGAQVLTVLAPVPR